MGYLSQGDTKHRHLQNLYINLDNSIWEKLVFCDIFKKL